MKYAILYDSHSGNTAKVAQEIRRALPAEDCLCFYSTIEHLKHPEVAADADLIFYGFWTNSGSCSETSQKVLADLPNTRIALFGTAGFGMSEEYFKNIIDRVMTFLPAGAQMPGSYMCAGKMPTSVEDQYKPLLNDPFMKDRAEMMLKNFKMVAGHPNKADLEAVANFAKKQYDAVK